uniref:Dorsal-like protein n=1 Tax=Paracyclopina nana TaxID=565004 RepID=A0A0S0GBS7_PARNA|nr:dorsal-like protein [Paracyclopina nana]
MKMADFANLDNIVQLGGATNEENNILGNIITEFNIDYIAEDQIQVTPNIVNPSRVECPDDNIVFDLIEDKLNAATEPTAEGEAIMAGLTGFGAAKMTNAQQSMGLPRENLLKNQQIYVKITEQPASNKLRFRYECEGRSAGALQGARSSSENKTFPSIEIVGYQGPAVVVVSCVEESPPHRTHPHNLVGKHCKKGVCSVEVNQVDMTCVFQNLGIQCVKRKDAPDSLTQRQEIRVDPYKQGFKHKTAAINLNAIRLCFQVFLKVEPNLVPLEPVVSEVIRDKKAHSDLAILNYSDNWSPVQGGKKILLFCEKVSKDDIEVHFSYQDQNSKTQVIKGHFTPNDVHKQYGISFVTPPFTDQKISQEVLTSMYLFKPSEQAQSDAIDFYFRPLSTNFDNGAPPPKAAQKRTKVKNHNDDEPSSRMKEIQPKYRASGGGVVIDKNEVKQEDEQPLMVDRILGLAAAQAAVAGQFAHPSNSFNNVNLNIADNDPYLKNLIQSGMPSNQQQHAPLQPAFSSDQLPENMSDLPNQINPDFLQEIDNMSSELRSMGIDDGKAINVSQGTLETPDISMEQSRNNSSFKMNNLNKF